MTDSGGPQPAWQREPVGPASGSVALVAGSATVYTSAVSPGSGIQLTTQEPGGVLGSHYVAETTPGVSFVIGSTSPSDTSTVAWQLTG